MDYRNILIITIIILILAAGYFFYKDVELDPQNAIVRYIEQESGYEITYSSAKLWPLNEITVEDLNLVGDNFILKAPRLNLGYSLFDYFQADSDVPEIIKYINLTKPELIYNSSTDPNTVNQLSLAEIRDAIFDQTDELYINIEDGSIIINQPASEYRISSLNTEFKINSSRKSIKLDIKKGLKTSGPILDEYQLENYTTDDFRISAELNNESWDLYLKNDDLRLNEFNKVLKEYWPEQFNQYQVSNLTGIAQIDLHLSGINESIESYKTNLKLAEIGFDFKLKDSPYQESVNVSEGSFHLNSNENKLIIENLDFNFNEVDYYLTGLYNLDNNNYSGQLSTKNFQIASDYVNRILKEDLPLDFTAQGSFNLNIDGDLENINLISSLKLDQFEVRGEEFNNLSAQVRYLNDTLYVDRLNLETINQAALEGKALYDFVENRYKVDIKGSRLRLVEYLDVDPIKEAVNQYNLTEYLAGKMDFELSLTGSGRIENNIAKADLSFKPNRENILRENGIRQISGNLMYENNKLFLDQGKLTVNGDAFNFFGQLNLDNQDIYARLRGQGISLASLNNSLGLNISQDNEINLTTTIKGKLNDPLIKGEIESNQLVYENYTANKIKTDFTYNSRQLTIENLNFTYDEIGFQGQGTLNIDKEFNFSETVLDFSLEGEEINYQKAAQYLDFELPVAGNIEPAIQISGSFTDIKAEAFITSDNTEVKYNGNSYQFEQVEATVTGSLAENRLELINGIMRRDDFQIILDGVYQNDRLNFNFQADNFALEDLELVENASGIFNLEGKVRGGINSPNLSLSFNSNNFRYNRFLSEEFTGQITYNNDTIKFKDIKLNKRPSNYLLNGSINDINGSQSLDIEISTDRGNTREILNFMDYSIPYNINYPFEGSINLTGTVSNPAVLIDLAVINNFKDILALEGNIAETIDLQLTGDEVPLSLLKSANILNTDISYAGSLNFTGTVQGEREDYQVNLDTNITDLEVANININDVNGTVSYNNKSGLTFNQSLNQTDDQNITAEGQLNLQESLITEIAVEVNNYRLNQIANIDGSISSFNGSVDGIINLSGAIQNPQLSGNMALDLTQLSIEGIADITDVKGSLAFDESRISLNEVQGKFGEGDFTLTGNINYLNQENFWEVRLQGENFQFNRGSYNGYYNPDVRILNEFSSPLIFGDLRLFDFVVDSELNWPTSESEEETGQPLFTPELKLNLIPGDNVYFRSDNIDIPVEEGSLQLNYQEEELTFLGQLRSQQGTIDYYNNKFLIDNVTANFERYSDNIPVIHLVGSTVAGGTRIFIYVDGPADNLNISFGSQPELPQDQIIALLTRRGGLRGFTSEEDVEPGSLVESELFRYVGEQVQLNFVQRVERSLANIFELDRFEIDTYSLAGEREVTVYLGKDLTDKLYLQYTGTFSPEIRDSEFTFEYDINKYLNLEGGWYGEDDYRFLLETTIEF